MKPVTTEVIHQREQLPARDRQMLKAAEADVEKGGELIVTGMQLIRDNRLYRETHNTFEDYCRERWERTARDVNRLIQTEQVVQAISEAMGPIGPKISRGAAREVADLPTDQAAEIVEKATETNGKPTAKAVKQARAQVAPKKISGGTSFNVGELEDRGKAVSGYFDGKFDDRLKTQRSKTVKTLESAMRAFDDLQELQNSPKHKLAVQECKSLIAIAREW